MPEPELSTPKHGAVRMLMGALADLRTVEMAPRAIQATAPPTEMRAEVLAGVIRAVEALETIRLPPLSD